LCLKIGTLSTADLCYVGVAGTIGDISLCSKVQNDSTRNICFGAVAVVKQDKSICNRIVERQDPYGGYKDLCYTKASRNNSAIPTSSKIPNIQGNSSQNQVPQSISVNESTMIEKLVSKWKTIGPGVLPGLPPLSQAFYGYPHTIQFIGKNRIIISYENDFNPLFAVLNYDSNQQLFSYLDGHGAPDFAVNETLWNTWRNKYGDISYAPRTYQFSSTRTGDIVYSSDWKLIPNNPFISVKSSITE
jgi:hypothetical protein